MPTTPASGERRRECPVQQHGGDDGNWSSRMFNYWSSPPPPSSPVVDGTAGQPRTDADETQTQQPVSSSCPIEAKDRGSFFGFRIGENTISEDQQPMVASLEEAAKYAQTRQPDQRFPLRTDRQVSSIPRGESDDKNPHHQLYANNSNRWVYPSEQQLYNAMRRKGYDTIPETSIPAVLQIHNFVNERTWQQIQDWEGNPSSLKLARFQGRPRDLTPKAWILTNVFQYEPPFDRHDWHVQTSPDGPVQRYVIDYYMNHKEGDMLPSTTVDARPALDHPRALYLHSRRFLQSAFPGITSYLRKQQALREQQQSLDANAAEAGRSSPPTGR